MINAEPHPKQQNAHQPRRATPPNRVFDTFLGHKAGNSRNHTPPAPLGGAYAPILALPENGGKTA